MPGVDGQHHPVIPIKDSSVLLKNGQQGDNHTSCISYFCDVNSSCYIRVSHDAKYSNIMENVCKVVPIDDALKMESLYST